MAKNYQLWMRSTDFPRPNGGSWQVNSISKDGKEFPILYTMDEAKEDAVKRNQAAEKFKAGIEYKAVPVGYQPENWTP